MKINHLNIEEFNPNTYTKSMNNLCNKVDTLFKKVSEFSYLDQYNTLNYIYRSDITDNKSNYYEFIFRELDEIYHTIINSNNNCEFLSNILKEVIVEDICNYYLLLCHHLLSNLKQLKNQIKFDNNILITYKCERLTKLAYDIFTSVENSIDKTQLINLDLFRSSIKCIQCVINYFNGDYKDHHYPLILKDNNNIEKIFINNTSEARYLISLIINYLFEELKIDTISKDIVVLDKPIPSNHESNYNMHNENYEKIKKACYDILNPNISRKEMMDSIARLKKLLKDNPEDEEDNIDGK